MSSILLLKCYILSCVNYNKLYHGRNNSSLRFSHTNKSKVYTIDESVFAYLLLDFTPLLYRK